MPSLGSSGISGARGHGLAWRGQSSLDANDANICESLLGRDRSMRNEPRRLCELHTDHDSGVPRLSRGLSKDGSSGLVERGPIAAPVRFAPWFASFASNKLWALQWRPRRPLSPGIPGRAQIWRGAAWHPRSTAGDARTVASRQTQIRSTARDGENRRLGGPSRTLAHAAYVHDAAQQKHGGKSHVEPE